MTVVVASDPQLVGKFFAGMGIGALQTQVPVYITEISPTKIRGALIIFGTIWLVPTSPRAHSRSSMGIFFSSICLKVIADKTPLDWLTPVYIQVRTSAISEAIS